MIVPPGCFNCWTAIGLGSRERVAVAIILFANCIRLCSIGLGSREVLVRTVGLGSRDLALFWPNVVPLDCLRYSLGAFCCGSFVPDSLLAIANAYPPVRFVSTAGLGSRERARSVTAVAAGLGSRCLVREAIDVEEFVLVAGLGSRDCSRATPVRP